MLPEGSKFAMVCVTRNKIKKRRVGYVVTILKENNESASVRQLAYTRVVYRRRHVYSITAISDNIDVLKL
jgi:hypothetical protein